MIDELLCFNCLCAGHKQFFKYLDLSMKKMAEFTHARITMAGAIGILIL